MKKLIVTDTHLGLYQDSDKWLDIVLQFFKDVVVYCHKNDIKEIFHLGDFFENRKSLNTKTQHTAHRIAKVLGVKGLLTRVIVGNHDCYFKNQLEPTSLELFNRYDHIEVIDHAIVIDDILLVPWGMRIPQRIQAKYCFGHFAINGFHMNDSYVCKKGIERNTFKDFEAVLSGHFHTPSKQGNITYLGAPYGQTFHDAGGVRGFYTFDDGQLDFIEYPKAPKFMKIRTEAIATHTSLNDDFGNEFIKGNVVRLVFDKDYGTVENQNIEDTVLSYEPFAYSIDFTKIDNEELEVDEARVENRGQMVDSYIDSQPYPENIQVGVLKTMFKQVMDEAESK